MTADTTTTPPMFLTAEGVNERIRKCHPATLRRALASGRIRGKLHGNRYYYETASVIAWMQGSIPPKKERPTAGLKRRRGRPRKEAAK